MKGEIRLGITKVYCSVEYLCLVWLKSSIGARIVKFSIGIIISIYENTPLKGKATLTLGYLSVVDHCYRPSCMCYYVICYW